METQKIVNLPNGSDNESSKFATKKWYVMTGNQISNQILNKFVRIKSL